MEIYPKAARTEFVGTYCWVVNCPTYARYMLSVYNEGRQDPKFVCLRHLSTTLKGMFIESDKGIVVQEIPGYWYNGKAEIVARDGILLIRHGNPEKGNLWFSEIKK